MTEGRVTATRYHDFCAGHRVVGQGGKCEHLHGHNYRVHFTVGVKRADFDAVDSVGRVLDFSVIKKRLCMWLEESWDHKFLAWSEDPLLCGIETDAADCEREKLVESIVWVDFNPTAENMAQHLVETVGPTVLAGTRARLIKVTIEETAKCSATYELED